MRFVGPLGGSVLLVTVSKSHHALQTSKYLTKYLKEIAIIETNFNLYIILSENIPLSLIYHQHGMSSIVEKGVNGLARSCLRIPNSSNCRLY